MARSEAGSRRAAGSAQAALRHLPLRRSKLAGLPSWRICSFFLILNTLRSLFVKMRLLIIHRFSKTLANHPTPVLEETDRRWGKRWGRAGVKCSSLAKSFQLQPAITRKGSCEDPLKGNVLTKAGNCINWQYCIHTCWAK